MRQSGRRLLLGELGCEIEVAATFLSDGSGDGPVCREDGGPSCRNQYRTDEFLDNQCK
jgi:hypothetical protein